MKIFIDDVRFPPDETWDDTFVSYLKAGKKEGAINQLLFRLIMSREEIEHISFDHDLADEEDFNGYEVLKLVLHYYKLISQPLPKISIHSSNPIGVERMEKLLEEYNQN